MIAETNGALAEVRAVAPFCCYALRNMSADHINPAGNLSDRRRTQRVLLRIPILVRAQFEGDAPITEDTTTLVVNAHGASIALAMKVRPGQKIVLRNWDTAKEQECRVVHSTERPSDKNEVGNTFLCPMPKFWNIDFPPPDWKPYME